MNEFYCVEFNYGECYYFKDKVKAFDFAWQQFLNEYAGVISDADLHASKEELYDSYFISDFVYLHVCGFED